MKKQTKFRKLYNFGTLMTIEEFLSDSGSGCLIDSDGIGFLATKTEQSNIKIKPSNAYHMMATHSGYRMWATHVMWI